MGFIEIIAFIRALPQLVSIMGEVVTALKQMKQDAIAKEIEVIKKDVDLKISTLIMATNDEERKKALLDLVRVISR